MNTKIAENIKALRKERRMTQEQLAEALGITPGAVHKWESGASLPEIRLLMEMADLFCVSVDVLLGYEMKNSGVDDIMERITEHLAAKDFDSAVSEAEKALLRYPNSFKIVYCCAELYQRKGIEMQDRAASGRAIELLERSIPLLPQNDDPEISEQTIRSDIAVCHISMKHIDKAIEILKRYNAGGVNNAMIALTSSHSEKLDLTEIEAYLMRASGDVFTRLVQTMSGYVNFYIRKGDIDSALDAAVWFVKMLDSLKISSDSVCYTDRLAVPFEALSASFLMYLGRQSEAEEYLHRAYKRAKAFDDAPAYGTEGIKFCGGDSGKMTASDDLGETAMLAVEKILSSDERNRPALERWNQLKAQ